MIDWNKPIEIKVWQQDGLVVKTEGWVDCFDLGKFDDAGHTVKYIPSKKKQRYCYRYCYVCNNGAVNVAGEQRGLVRNKHHEWRKATRIINEIADKIKERLGVE